MLTSEEKNVVRKLALKYHHMSHPMGIIAQCIVNSPEGGGCFGAYTQFYATAYGDINPCDFNPVTFGNIRQMPLEQIWRKMLSHPEFTNRRWSCRMQSEDYRRKFIDRIPDDMPLPVPIEFFDQHTP
jgi:MoaA/NifB/PqqE/SkfB family radical SAM enzyme